MPGIKIILRLIRLPNLLIIASVLYLQRFCIILPKLQNSGIDISRAGYGLIVFGTVLIAAGGYLVNDYFDIEIDAVNRPDRADLLQSISQEALKKVYFVVTLAGLASIALACYLSGAYLLWFVYLLAALVLFWYSRHLKKLLILGNLAVALASAFTMPAAWLFDWLTLSGYNGTNPEFCFSCHEISIRIIIYSIFAFFISFAREIIKDIEDIEGDARFGCKSLPTVYGVMVAKRIIVSCFTLVLVMLCFWQRDLYKANHPGIAVYLAIAVDLPIIWLSVLVFNIHTKAESHRAGLITKIIMVTGILSMLWFLI